MAHRISWLLGLAGWVLLARPAQAQLHLNLTLEPGANHGHPLALWARRRAPNVRVQFDSTVARQGRGSLRFELAEEEEPAFMAIFTTAFPLDSVRGQLVTVSGWVRTRGFRGRAGVYAFAGTRTSEGYGGDHAEALDSLPVDMDWRRVELRLPASAVAQDFGIGVRAYGSGRVWFDDLQVRVGGKSLGHAPLPGTEILLLTPAEALTPNWDFERPLPRLTRPDPAQATATPDSAQPQHGRRYLHLARTKPASGAAPAVYLGTLAVTPAMYGKSLQVSGFWRQTGPAVGVEPSFAYALHSTDEGTDYHADSPTHWHAGGLQPLPALPAPGLQWAAFSASIPIPNDVPRLAALTLSLRLPGGAVDVDNLQFTLNGTPYVPAGLPTPPAPTAAEIAWLRTVAKPLQLDAPAADFPDLAPLGSLVGAARLVALGEAVPGSHEVAELHGRLVRYLVGQKGFTGLVLDASPARCAALNAYLQAGQGDPARLLAALGPAWAGTELLDLVRWLRGYNQTHPGGKALVAGLDVQQPELALSQLSETLDAKDDFSRGRLRQLAPLLAATAHPSGTDLDLARHPDLATDSLLPAVRRLLAEVAAGLDTRAKLTGGNALNLRTLERQRYYLRLVEQGTTLRRLPPDDAPNYREACLADNVQWLGQHEGPGGGPAKLVLWLPTALAANAVAPYHYGLGQRLRSTHGAGYVALATVLGQGSYATQPASGGRLAATPLAAAATGSYEAWLRTGPPAFILTVNKLELIDANAWLFQQQLLRDAGLQATPYQFRLHHLLGEFDAVLFLRDSTPRRPLP